MFLNHSRTIGPILKKMIGRILRKMIGQNPKKTIGQIPQKMIGRIRRMIIGQMRMTKKSLRIFSMTLTTSCLTLLITMNMTEPRLGSLSLENSFLLTGKCLKLN